MNVRTRDTNHGMESFLDALAEYGSTAPPLPRPPLVSRLDGHTPLHAVPDPLAAPPAGAAASRRRRRLRPIAATLFAGTVVFGGLASAGALPAPLQRVSAEVGARIGIDLPVPDPAHPAPSAPRPAKSRRAEQPPRGAGETGRPANARATTRVPPTTTATSPSVPLPTDELPLPVPLPPVPTTPTAAAASDSPPPRLNVSGGEVRRILGELSNLAPAP